MVTKKAKTVQTIDPNTSSAAGVAPATEFDPSGAPIQTVADVDPSHPAVDADPRANTTDEQNRIDFNDPSLSGSEAVAKALGYQAESDEGK